MEKSDRKIGLALGGGAVLGAAHVGVLKAVHESGIKIDYIAGTSIGAFVGAFFAFGKSCDEIEEIALKLNWIDIAELSLSRYGLLSNEKMGKLLHQHIGNAKIEESDIPLAMVATDAASGEKVVINSGSVTDGIKASTCIPGIFNPIEIDEKMLLDGGIVENVPIQTVRNMGADYVIGVDLNAQFKYEKPQHIFDVLLNSFHFTMLTSSRLQSREADLLIKPNLSNYSRSNMDHLKDLMQQGYDDAKKALEDFE